MPKNDAILVDGIIEQRLADRGGSLGDVFESFAFEQLLKDYDLSEEEIEHGWVDGHNDGGVDGFYIFVNGVLVRDLGSASLPRRSAELELWIITSKHHATFQQAPLNALLASLPELLDLSKSRSELDGRYSEDLLEAKDLLLGVYRKLSASNPRLTIHLVYASRGDSEHIADNVTARARQLERLCEELFSAAQAEFRFVGSSELILMHRRIKNFTLELPCLEHLSSGRSGYLVLVRLDEYFRFVTDEAGNLRRYLFDSNVRDYLGPNAVNHDIVGTLSNPDSPDFWWLNNGVTVLATSAAASGKTIRLQDIQIVNGLQTTESIYRYYSSAGFRADGRAVLVKIIVITDPKVRDQIIMATNNQSAVEPSALRATDKVQRDIEEVLERSDWYYERRKNYYRNNGKPLSRFVTPMFLAAGYLALAKRRPAAAARAKIKLLQNDEKYHGVFSDAVPLDLWPAMVGILKRVDEELSAQRPKVHGDRFLANWRYLIAFLCVACLRRSFAFSQVDLMNLDVSQIDERLVAGVWSVVAPLAEAWTVSRPTRSELFIHQCCEALTPQYQISHVESTRPQATVPTGTVPPTASLKRVRKPGKDKRRVKVSAEVLERVDQALPSQPWPPHVHKTVASDLGLSIRVTWSAIQDLLDSGQRYRQKDGVVFSPDGYVIAYDKDRVPEERLLKLRARGKLSRIE